MKRTAILMLAAVAAFTLPSCASKNSPAAQQARANHAAATVALFSKPIER